MVEIIENRFVFRNKMDFVYCYNCKKEMSFNGYGYECAKCGSTYKEKVVA